MLEYKGKLILNAEYFHIRHKMWLIHQVNRSLYYMGCHSLNFEQQGRQKQVFEEENLNSSRDGFEKKMFCTWTWCKIYLIPYMLQTSCNLNWFRHLLQNCKWPAGVNGVLFLSWSPPSWWETIDEIYILFTTYIYTCSRHRHHSKLHLGCLRHFQREDIWLLM